MVMPSSKVIFSRRFLLALWARRGNPVKEKKILND
jgi:hypothetical protein